MEFGLVNVSTEDHCTVHYHTGVKLAEVQREGEPKVGLRIKIEKAKYRVVYFFATHHGLDIREYKFALHPK